MKIKASDIIAYVLRLVTGAVFVFSGFVKAIDPWGGMYKIHEYMMAMDMHLSYEADCALAVLLAAAEFSLGICLMCGVMRRFTLWCLAAFMAVMTPLTFWIWLTDPVADCGCFGDVLVLSNGMTFAKNIVLCGLTALLFVYNGRVRPSIVPAIQWLAVIASFIYAGLLSMVGYNRQPLIDFRPYPVGTELVGDVEEDDVRMVYERDGVTHEFGVDDLPGDDWTFVERVQASAEHGLSVFDADGDDVTDDVLDVDSAFVLVINDVPRHGISRSYMQNNMKAYADSLGYDMFGLLAVQPDDLPAWRERMHAGYEVYAADDSDLKELVRGDAALLIVKDGKIAYKSNLYAFGPEAFVVGEKQDFGYSAKTVLSWLTSIYVVFMLLLLANVSIFRKPTKMPVAKLIKSDKNG